MKFVTRTTSTTFFIMMLASFFRETHPDSSIPKPKIVKSHQSRNHSFFSIYRFLLLSFVTEKNIALTLKRPNLIAKNVKISVLVRKRLVGFTDELFFNSWLLDKYKNETCQKMCFWLWAFFWPTSSQIGQLTGHLVTLVTNNYSLQYSFLKINFSKLF